MEQFGMDLLGILLPVLAAVLTAVVSWAISKLAKKWGIQLDMSKDAAMRTAIRTAIGGAEEWAERKWKIDCNRSKGAEKAKWVHDQVSALWPTILPDNLDNMIDEELAAMSGVGATGDTVVGIPNLRMPLMSKRATASALRAELVELEGEDEEGEE